MVEMAEYFAENLQIIVHGFARAGILGALGGYREERPWSTRRIVKSSN